MATYETVVGLEVHVQLNTSTKIFAVVPQIMWVDCQTHMFVLYV